MSRLIAQSAEVIGGIITAGTIGSPPFVPACILLDFLDHKPRMRLRGHIHLQLNAIFPVERKAEITSAVVWICPFSEISFLPDNRVSLLLFLN